MCIRSSRDFCRHILVLTVPTDDHLSRFAGGARHRLRETLSEGSGFVGSCDWPYRSVMSLWRRESEGEGDANDMTLRFGPPGETQRINTTLWPLPRRGSADRVANEQDWIRRQRGGIQYVCVCRFTLVLLTGSLHFYQLHNIFSRTFMYLRYY